MSDKPIDLAVIKNAYTEYQESSQKNSVGQEVYEFLEAKDTDHDGLLTSLELELPIPEYNEISDICESFQKLSSDATGTGKTNLEGIEGKFQRLKNMLMPSEEIVQPLEIQKRSIDEMLSGGALVTQFQSQYDLSDWNNDEASLSMYDIGDGIYRLEATFNVDGAMDTGYESAGKWVFLIDAKYSSPDERMLYMGVDPRFLHENSNSDQDGTFYYTNNERPGTFNDIIPIYHYTHCTHYAPQGLGYVAEPWFSSNTKEFVTFEQMYIRMNSILEEIAKGQSNGPGRKFYDVWRGVTYILAQDSATVGSPQPLTVPVPPVTDTGSTEDTGDILPGGEK